MTIQKGLIWDYYDCTHACYLFGKYNLPCFLMSLSILLFWFGLLVVVFLIYRYIQNKRYPLRLTDEQINLISKAKDDKVKE